MFYVSWSCASILSSDKHDFRDHIVEAKAVCELAGVLEIARRVNIDDTSSIILEAIENITLGYSHTE